MATKPKTKKYIVVAGKHFAKGVTYEKGKEISLTDEQAKRLKNKVTPLIQPSAADKVKADAEAKELEKAQEQAVKDAVDKALAESKAENEAAIEAAKKEGFAEGKAQATAPKA